MRLKADVIQTGSSGNCVILENVIALDMGVPFKKIFPYMKNLQVVLVGHEHSDHFNESTIRRLAQARPALKFVGGDFMAEKFLNAGVRARNIKIVEAGKKYPFELDEIVGDKFGIKLKPCGSFEIEPIELHHDVPCYGFKIWINGGKAVYIVDTGNLDGISAPDFDLYLVEANHFEWEIDQRASEKLAAGQFAYEIRAANNHLSFEQTMNWFEENMSDSKTGEWIPLHRHEDRRDGEENCQKASDITG